MGSCRDARRLCLLYPGRIVFLLPAKGGFQQSSSQARCNARAHAEVTRLTQLPTGALEAALFEEVQDTLCFQLLSPTFPNLKQNPATQHDIICLLALKKKRSLVSQLCCSREDLNSAVISFLLFSFHAVLRRLCHSPSVPCGQALFVLVSLGNSLICCILEAP